jgi:hypothetical protein
MVIATKVAPHYTKKDIFWVTKQLDMKEAFLREKATF